MYTSPDYMFQDHDLEAKSYNRKLEKISREFTLEKYLVLSVFGEM